MHSCCCRRLVDAWELVLQRITLLDSLIIKADMNGGLEHLIQTSCKFARYTQKDMQRCDI